jgi:Rod binding domain-containing protein
MESQALNPFPAESLGARTVDRAKLALHSAKEGRTEEAADSFQKLLCTMLVKEMGRSLPEGLFGEGQGADVYQGWFDEHLGQALAERDTLGFAEIVRADLMRREAMESPTDQAPEETPEEITEESIAQ